MNFAYKSFSSLSSLEWDCIKNLFYMHWFFYHFSSITSLTSLFPVFVYQFNGSFRIFNYNLSRKSETNKKMLFLIIVHYDTHTHICTHCNVWRNVAPIAASPRFLKCRSVCVYRFPAGCCFG